MKNLIYLVMFAFCFANAQDPPKTDSVIKSISEKVVQVKNLNKENETLIKELISEKQKKIASDSQQKAKKKASKIQDVRQSERSDILEAVKPENDLTPTIEIPIQYEYVRGNFIYRLFHKDNYKIKFYKIVNDEKIYLN